MRKRGSESRFLSLPASLLPFVILIKTQTASSNSANEKLSILIEYFLPSFSLYQTLMFSAFWLLFWGDKNGVRVWKWVQMANFTVQYTFTAAAFIPPLWTACVFSTPQLYSLCQTSSGFGESLDCLLSWWRHISSISRRGTALTCFGGWHLDLMVGQEARVQV